MHHLRSAIGALRRFIVPSNLNVLLLSMRMFQTGRFLTLNVSNTDLANLYVLSLAALGGGLVGAGVSQLKPGDLNIFNLLKPPKPSGKVLKISIRCELQMKDKGRVGPLGHQSQASSGYFLFA